MGVCKSCSSKQIMQEITLFFGKIYTAGTNITRPPVVTVATNLNSAKDGMNCGAYFPRFCSEPKILDPVLSAWGFLLASTGSVDSLDIFQFSLVCAHNFNYLSVWSASTRETVLNGSLLNRSLNLL